MFLDSMRGSNRKQLEIACETLRADLKKKKIELDQKEMQIQRLSKNNRKWVRKYNELELSMSENIIDSLDAEPSDEAKAHKEETKRLQMMLIKLNQKNQKLERRMEKMAELLEKSSKADTEKQQAEKEIAPSIVADESLMSR